jgi:hypothetical protein
MARKARGNNVRSDKRVAASCVDLYERVMARPRVREDLVQRLLGFSNQTFARVRADMARGEASPFLNAKLSSRLAALLEQMDLVEAGQRVSISVEDYAERTRRTIAALTRGAMYTLVSVPPPLETEFVDLRIEVVKAASKGVKFRYYYPVEEWYRQATARFMRTPARLPAERCDVDHSLHAKIRRSITNDSERVAAFRTAFRWLANASSKIQSLKDDLLMTARTLDAIEGQDRIALDERTGAPVWHGPFVDLARNNIIFRPMTWVPISFESKIAWVTHDDQHSIQAEVLTPTQESGARGMYDLHQLWSTSPNPYDPSTLRALIRLAGARNRATGCLIDEFLPASISIGAEESLPGFQQTPPPDARHSEATSATPTAPGSPSTTPGPQDP